MSYRFRRYLALFAVFLVIMPLSFQHASASTQSYRQFQKGMTYIWYWQDSYSRPESDHSLRDLASTGTNWVSLIVTWYEHTLTDSVMFPTPSTPTDASLIHAIRTIHSLGMRVMVKPHIDPLQVGAYRESLNPSNVTAWFRNYRDFIDHYATLANSEGVEQFCIGTELVSMSQYTTYWYNIIDSVRESFAGKLTYAAIMYPWADEWRSVQFWDRLDYVGIDVYPTLTYKPDPPVADLSLAWVKYVKEIEAFQQHVNKPIVFTEIGWMSVATADTMAKYGLGDRCNPNDPRYDPSQCKPDPQIQANLYEAALQIFWNKSWLQGIFWWTWYPYGTTVGWGEGGPNDAYYSPHNKPAEKVLHSWYAKPFIPQGTTQEAVPALTAIQEAENATADAMRDGRTRGLDQAESLLSQAIGKYNQGDFERSETLANEAAKSADDAVSQEKYDEAATAVNQALEKLSTLRNATLQSPDAIQLKQESEAEYNSALTALHSNEFDLAKLHASNATVLAEKALTAEHDFQVRQALLRQQQEQKEQQELLLLFEAAAVAASVLIAILAVRARKRK